jgi:5-methylcytosine-specific restriction endonuclease McrA
MKICSKCKAERPLSAFGKDRLRRDGLFPQCKSCRLRDAVKSERIEEMRSQGLRHCSCCKQWQTPKNFGSNASRSDGLHTMCKPCSSLHAKLYARENRGKVLMRQKVYREGNRDKIAAKWQTYYKKNAHRLILRANGKRREYDPSMDTLTGEEWRAIIREQKGACAHCQRLFTSKFVPTRDHIIPLSAGGYLTRNNTQALCRGCNARKGAKIPSELITV